MDHHLGMKKLVEDVNIACIAGSQPAEDDGLSRVGHVGSLAPSPAPSY